MAAVANPEDIDQKFRKAVKKSAKEADDMEEKNKEMNKEIIKDEKDDVEQPGILATIKDKAGTVVHKVAEAVHKITDTEPHHEGQVNNKEPPIGAHNQAEAEYYAERASEKFDSENSSLSSKRKPSK